MPPIFTDLHQWMLDNKLLTEGWLIFYAGILFAFVLWVTKRFWSLIFPKPTTSEPEKSQAEQKFDGNSNSGIGNVQSEKVEIKQEHHHHHYHYHNSPEKESPKDVKPITIKIDRLPTVAGKFFGRETELQMLDDALASNKTRILQFIASGGTGKTKLIRHWLNQHLNEIGNYLIWSFYSQGTSDSKQVSLTPLLTEAFNAFGVDDSDYATDEERADALADLLIDHQCLLVLDGLEPMQHGGQGFDGQLKDRATKRLLQTLAQRHSNLCIITSRLPVHELKDRAHVLSHSLNNLATADGVKLLRSWGVVGRDKELQTAVTEVEGHALTLHLLGNAITTYLGKDIRKRDTLDELIDDYGEQGRHAFKVMQGYQHWLSDDAGKPTAELQLLYLLGLFDHPIEDAVLQVLWDKHIPQLTAGIPNKAWKVAIASLKNKHRLLSAHGERPDLLDCHPLIREYFGKQLQQRKPDAWQQAHETLYHYYKALPEKQQPDTVADMQPLFHAVAHGCAAGLHQQALDKVYWPRIRREGEAYIAKKLGAFSDDLAVVAHFFSQPWRVPAAGLGEIWQAGLLNWAGFRLRALGRLTEAVEPMEASIQNYVKQANWKDAAASASNLSELQLTLGRVTEAVDSGQRSVNYADQSGDLFHRMAFRTTHADALHQAGQLEAALAGFKAAELLHQEHQPAYPRLYSLWGFKYCDLLLTQRRVEEMLERAEYALLIAQKHSYLLSIALDQLSLGRAHHAQGDLPQAQHWLNQAVAGLREAGDQDMLPRGLLARASAMLSTSASTLLSASSSAMLSTGTVAGDADDVATYYAKAQQDLDEVRDIAEPSGMRLYLTDYYVASAHLLLAQGKPTAEIQTCIDEAAKLIEETGYYRRDEELAALRRQIAQ